MYWTAQDVVAFALAGQSFANMSAFGKHIAVGHGHCVR